MAIGQNGIPPELQSLESISIHAGLRQSGEWAVTVSLAEKGLESPFCQLCALVCNAARMHAEASDAVRLLTRELWEWRQLMKLGRSGRLSPSEQRGLFAELALLRLLLKSYSPSQVLPAWQGPRGAPQDFRLPHMRIECKAIQLHTSEIKISSLEQLESSETPLYITAIPLGEATEGRSLSQVVLELRSLIEPCAESLLLYEAALSTLGYRDDDDYSTPSYEEHRHRWFLVCDEFPRLTRANLGPAITAAHYALDLAALSEFCVKAVYT
jgi:hypothetical protein